MKRPAPLILYMTPELEKLLQDVQAAKDSAAEKDANAALGAYIAQVYRDLPKPS